MLRITREEIRQSLLWTAVNNGWLRTVTHLLGTGTSVDKKEENNSIGLPHPRRGYAPIHLAVLNHDAHMLELLMEHGADINLKDNHCRVLESTIRERRRIFRSSHNRHFGESIFYIVNRYGDVHQNTPLHLASRLGFTELVEILIRNGANFHAKNRERQTPGDVANPQLKSYLSVQIHKPSSLQALCARSIVLNGVNPQPDDLPFDLHLLIDETKRDLIFTCLFKPNEATDIKFKAPVKLKI